MASWNAVMDALRDAVDGVSGVDEATTGQTLDTLGNAATPLVYFTIEIPASSAAEEDRQGSVMRSSHDVIVSLMVKIPEHRAWSVTLGALLDVEESIRAAVLPKAILGAQGATVRWRTTTREVLGGGVAIRARMSFLVSHSHSA